jgi:hypothetical protein
VIVTLSGWVYIVIAVLALFGMTQIRGTGEKMMTLAGIAVLITVGLGLLKRRNWARWLMLGMSLLTWTLGSLLLLWTVVGAFQVSQLWEGQPLAIHVFTFLMFALGCAFIWLNYRLFEHLTSDDGRDEFDTPESESHAVAKSSAVYIAWCVVSMMVAEPGMIRRDRSDDFQRRVLAEMARRSTEPTSDAVRRERVLEQQRLADENAVRGREAAAEYARRAASEAKLRKVEHEESRAREQAVAASRAKAQEELHRKTRELFIRRSRESGYTDEQFDADRKRLTREFSRSMDAGSAANRSNDTSERPSSTILKCRDSGGSISFTQGYCPTGTTRVESPPAD